MLSWIFWLFGFYGLMRTFLELFFTIMPYISFHGIWKHTHTDKIYVRSVYKELRILSWCINPYENFITFLLLDFINQLSETHLTTLMILVFYYFWLFDMQLFDTHFFTKPRISFVFPTTHIQFYLLYLIFFNRKNKAIYSYMHTFVYDIVNTNFSFLIDRTFLTTR